MFKISLEKTNTSFQISVGEEGAVIVYIKGNKVQNRLFVRTTETHDTQKLSQLLSSDNEASISLYLDTIDQSYVQRQIPGVNAFSVNKIAQNRLEREIPKNYLKTFVPISRNASGRKDWIYTFIAASYDVPLSKWVEFLVPYPNIIEGIYFLPVELSNIIVGLRSSKKNTNKPKFKLSNLKNWFRKDLILQSAKSIGWEILICQNKTGGFRLVAFLNSKIVFSRLLNNISDPDPDVTAGNIEQEISNSMEYLSRLGFSNEENTNIYIILSQDILKFIRIDKIKATVIENITPYQAAIQLGIPEVATDKDKFFDPVFLVYSFVKSVHSQRLHVEQTIGIYKAALFTHIIKKSLLYAIPIIIILIASYLYDFFNDQFSINNFKDQISNFTLQYNDKTYSLNTVTNQIQSGLPLKQIGEIVDLDKFMKQPGASAVDVALKLSEALPEYALVKSFNWIYYDPSLLTFKLNKEIKVINFHEAKNYKVTVTLETVFTSTGDTYQELQRRYEKFEESIKAKFTNAYVDISSLPTSFNFESSDAKLTFVVKITYPISNSASSILNKSKGVNVTK